MKTDQAERLIGFALALGKLKKASENGESVQLTKDEIDGIIYGVMTLRGTDDTAEFA